MKRVSILATALVLMAALAQAGDMAHSGSAGIQTSLGVATSPVLSTNTIGAKFFVSNAFALRIEGGIQVNGSFGGGSNTTGYAVGGGFEYHMTPVGGVSPYVGVQFGFGGGSTPSGGSTPTLFGVAGVFGGEYFFSSNFSWAGELGFGFKNLNSGGTSATQFGTGSATLILSWYLN